MFVVFIIHFNSAKEFSEFQIALWATQFSIVSKNENSHLEIICLWFVSHFTFMFLYLLYPPAIHKIKQRKGILVTFHVNHPTFEHFSAKYCTFLLSKTNHKMDRSTDLKNFSWVINRASLN